MFKLYINPLTHRKEVDIVFKEAMAEKNKGHYKEAVSLLETALAKDSENEVIKAHPEALENSEKSFDH